MGAFNGGILNLGADEIDTTDQLDGGNAFFVGVLGPVNGSVINLVGTVDNFLGKYAGTSPRRAQ